MDSRIPSSIKEPEGLAESSWRKALERRGWKDWGTETNNPELSVMFGDREVVRVHDQVDGTKYRVAEVLEHVLVALTSEPDKRGNHVHLKQYRYFGCDRIDQKIRGADAHEYIYASSTREGRHELNRRELVEAVNRSTGLNLDYKD